MVSTLVFHAGDPGSIPGVVRYINFVVFFALEIDLVTKKLDFQWFLIPISLNAQRL